MLILFNRCWGVDYRNAISGSMSVSWLLSHAVIKNRHAPFTKYSVFRQDGSVRRFHKWFATKHKQHLWMQKENWKTCIYIELGENMTIFIAFQRPLSIPKSPPFLSCGRLVIFAPFVVVRDLEVIIGDRKRKREIFPTSELQHNKGNPLRPVVVMVTYETLGG